MRRADQVRLAAISAAVLPLAIFAGFHSVASVRAVDAATEAVDLFPAHGIAQSNVAFARFYERVGEISVSAGPDGKQAVVNAEEVASALARAARASSDDAKRAYLLEPLSPKAHTILALTASDLAARNQIIANASQLNKRQLALQGLALEKNIAEGSYPKTIETIDQVLRAHPEVFDRFFPILVEILAIDATRPQLAELFSKPLPWRQPFMTFALRDQRVIRNLGLLRTEVELDNKDFDQQLIGRLVETGEIDTARAVYKAIRPSASRDAATGKLDWASDFPPFEWRLASSRGFRSQPATDGKAIEVNVNPGEGGVIASRLITPPKSKFAIRLSHDMKFSGPLDTLKLQVACFPEGAAVFESVVKKQTETFAVDVDGANCSAYQLVLTARSWTGSKAIRGSISTVALEAR